LFKISNYESTNTTGAMKTLHLTLKKQWFDLIASGEKREEYREIKRYWADRLTYHEHHERITCENSLADEIYADQHRQYGTGVFKNLYDAVQFKNGYRKDSPVMLFKLDIITWGAGVPAWGAEPGVKYFVIKLGERIK
jgi:hypothetical protein